MRSWAHALFVFGLAACGDEAATTTTTDGGQRADASPTCSSVTPPLAAGAHTLYVAFEGVNVTLGACDDSHANCSSLVAQSSTVVPAFLAAETNRATRIASITALVRDALAPFSIVVVTSRPASGHYWMVVAGGTSDAVAGQVGIATLATSVCTATNLDSLGFVFELDPETTDRTYADHIAGTLGALVGLVPTTKSGDCTCVTSACAHAQTCTFGTNIAVPPGNACSRTTQNEQQLLMDAIGCR
jgi:hypothetical protein